MGELEQLENNFDKIIDEYTYLFCKKYNLQFDFWVADDKGTIACFDTFYYINFDDIKYDINKKQDQFLSYYEYCENRNFKNCLNYKTYCRLFKDEKSNR